MSDRRRMSEESNGALRRPAEQSPAGPIRLLLPLILLLALSPPRPLAAQTTADSALWRHVAAVQVAQFLHHDAPHGGITLESADSSGSRDWSIGLLLEVSHLYDSLKRTTPGDSAQGGKVTFGPLLNFEQPYGGIPRQRLQFQFTESICIEGPGGAKYLSGATYNVRLFTRAISAFADINFAEAPEGYCTS